MVNIIICFQTSKSAKNDLKFITCNGHIKKLVKFLIWVMVKVRVKVTVRARVWVRVWGPVQRSGF